MNIFIPVFLPHGTVDAVPSKSDLHRALICASLCDTPTFIHAGQLCEDTGATVRCLRALGGRVECGEKGLTVCGKLTGGGILDCGESGSTLRFLLPVAAVLGKRTEFTGSGKLPLRPMRVLLEALREKGLKADSDFLPISIDSRAEAGEYRIPGNISSQFVSGLMMALPVSGKESVIRLTTKPESELYIEMTRYTLGKFGIHWEKFTDKESKATGYRYTGGDYVSPGEYITEGDWSGAAFFAVMGALKGSVTVNGLNNAGIQPDRNIINIIKSCGARVTLNGNGFSVCHDKLGPFRADVSGFPDLFPVLAVLACGAEGDSLLYNAARLRIKESDRIETTAELIRSLGGSVSVGNDWLEIHGKGYLDGGIADGAGDHRIVMSAAVASVISKKGVLIKGSEAVGKSYGDFFEAIRNCGAVPSGKDE